ncbi:DNA cytosine methyltransferase [Sphingomonas prati]|uniref:DNA (cytosine-5-)-methyltransferase n=1 Tax=Sphingomonas prati TaxID=1843237 RepID=A0A7W9BV08_9SPHN|nr:DNA cytosine methyltransferase [Sphingomonas prati]MBB5730620.1 DNA (cytosine-5)-methyltransferase 1 [Sphingomonas prati]GGE95474.1 restriction endonuclease subunit M [Sphingomonas prati]
MKSNFKVVDLFAGPGGLAEGFSRHRNAEGHQSFEIALSVEKEAAAFSTLRLRSFVRQFSDTLPTAYYRYVAGEIDRDQLTSAYPREWAAACAETIQLELGASGADQVLYPRLDAIRAKAGQDTVLIGGPPCQAYSVVGRSRNQGIADYVAGDDHRHYLYEQYIDIIGRLQPAAFIMENVKGILSARVDKDRIFPKVLTDLRSSGGKPNSYILFPLVASEDHRGSEHVIEAERFGIPQCRHRVILFGVRRDIAESRGGFRLDSPKMQPSTNTLTVQDVLGGMPPLRSGLSRTADTPGKWREAVAAEFRTAALAAFEEEDEQLDRIAFRLAEHANALEIAEPPPRHSAALSAIRNNELSDWLIDPKLLSLPNHEARSHMTGDLCRYAFAAAFAEEVGRSPKAAEFPEALAPAHVNWLSGKFADRFRVQRWGAPSTTITSHISKDGHYFIHPDPLQCRSLTVREAARLQTFPDNYYFEGNRTEQYIQVGNAVPPLLAFRIADVVEKVLSNTVHSN